MSPRGNPVGFEPSGNFLGDDGEWSTFILRVGSPPQIVQVLASTQVPETWLVHPKGCLDSEAKCSEARGGIYYRTNSTTSKGSSSSENPSGRYNVYPLQAESNLGMWKNFDVGEFGFDTVEIGRPGDGDISPNSLQVIATVATKDFFIGTVGLSARQVSAMGSGTASGLLTSLNDERLIPSRSYGYTAGAAYQKSNASLTFGGVDSSKFTANDVEFSLAKPETRELIVELQSVVSTDPKGNSKTLFDKPIPMLLDSTVPHLWLPIDACQQFERAFGLVYNSTSNFYFVDGKLHDQLTKQIANITLALRPPQSQGPDVEITLPYASFDLDTTPFHPEAKWASKYFPLRQAQNDSQYTLGRALFQELYLKVNYETSRFSVSQALHAPDESSNLVAIPSGQATGTGGSPPITIMTTTAKPSSKSHGLATPAIAGIVIALIVLLLLIGGVILCRHRRRRKAKRELRVTPELPADPPYPAHARELEASEKPGPQKSVPNVPMEEKGQAQQIYNTEIGLMNQGASASHGAMVELPSPDPSQAELQGQDSYLSELPSSVPVLGSGLSTPEPESITRSELSTPEPGDGTAAEASPSLDGIPSPVSSSSPLWSGKRRREPYIRKDSYESEAGWNPNGSIRISRPSMRHFRMVSSESERSVHPERVPSGSSRPMHVRHDSSESEGGVGRGKFGQRPAHRRLDSSDSVETRLALNSPAARLERPWQALPIIGPDPPPSPPRPSPSSESIKSGLLSPTPLGFVDEGEARNLSDPEQRRGDHPPQKEADGG